MHELLPTCTFDSCAVTSLRDSLVEELDTDSEARNLTLFFYGITLSGWAEIKQSVLDWSERASSRKVSVYIGTDHGITDPAAMQELLSLGLNVRVMDTYSGVFHPKLVWLQGAHGHLVWVGSNNLTGNGLLHNIEFAVLIKSSNPPDGLIGWADAVHSGSSRLTQSLILSYKKERERFEKRRATAKLTTFTWSKRKQPKKEQNGSAIGGDLIVEIMPEETRGGNQIQLPKAAAKKFFGISSVGDQTTIQLRRNGTRDVRSLVVTVFGNNTIRLSINELEYRDRPCVIVFRKDDLGVIEFEIVSESIFPSRYRYLLSRCLRQTRPGSRRWEIIK